MLPQTLMRFALAFLFAGLSAGCALLGPQMHDVGAQGGSMEIANFPHFPYEDYFGATAAVSTVISAQKIAVVPGDLIKPLNVPERKGFLQAEIQSTIRSYGLVPYVLQSKHADLDLIQEVQAGHPVMVLLNLGGPSDPVWRYAVVFGVDPDDNSLVLRSGREARQRLTFGELLSQWHDGRNWAMVAARPDQIPVSALLREWVVAAAPLEQMGKADAAARADLAATQRWPKELLAWEALGNARYAANDLPGSTLAFINALFIAPNDGNARNNLAQVLLERSCAEQAQAQIEQALASETDPLRRAIYSRTREAILAHSGPSIVCPGV